MSASALVAWWALLASVAHAQEPPATPFPDFQAGQRVYVGPGIEKAPYVIVANRIEEVEKSGKETYYAAVVKSSGTGNDPTSRYADALTRLWRQQGGDQFDPERSIVIVVALENRRVAVHPGQFLRTNSILDRGTIEQELVGPVFVPKARAGQYPEAIVGLINAIDAHIKRETKAREARRIDAERRDAASRAEEQRRRTAQNEARHRFMTRTLPLIGVGSVTAGAIAVLGIGRYRNLSARRSAEARIKEVRSRATALMERLDQLKERHARLLSTDPDFKEPLQGQTLVAYVHVRDTLKGLWDRWLEVMDALQKAQELAAKEASFGTGQLAEAEKLLQDEARFDELSRQAETSQAELDRLGNAHEAAFAAVKALDEEAAKLKTKLLALGEARLATTPYQSEQDAAARLTSNAEKVLTPDPLTALEGFAQARETVQALNNRIQNVLDALEASRQALAAIEQAAARADQLRATGLKLEETGGNPTPLLSQAREAHAQTIDALGRGDLTAAGRALEAARALADQASSCMERVAQAKALALRDLPVRSGEVNKLREALRQARAYQDRLEAEFAAGSWSNVADHLSRAQSLTERAQAAIAPASEAATETSQRYLEAARLLEGAAQDQQQALRLMAALGEQLGALEKARNDTQKALPSIDALAREVGGILDREDRIVGEAARSAHADAQRALEVVQARMADSHPDWPQLRERLAQADAGFRLARERAEADLRVFGELRSLLESARRRVNQIEALLRDESADRAAANTRFRGAREAIELASQASEAPRGDWNRLLDDTRQALADLDQAERLAHQDIQLAHQATAAIGAAQRTIHAAQAFTDMGMSADTRPAEDLEAQAERQLRSQDYERAVELAAAAERSARDAYDDAVSRARRRRDQLEAERRWRDAAEAARRGHGPRWSSPGAQDFTDLFTTVAGAVVTAATQAAQRGASHSIPGRARFPSPSASTSTSWSEGASAPTESSESGW